MRKYGLACDNLLSVDLVTAEGDFMTVSADEHPDLFWGLRGAVPTSGSPPPSNSVCTRLDPCWQVGWSIRWLEQRRFFTSSMRSPDGP